MRLLPDFDLFRMLVPDLLHEVELGITKNLLQHLVRMLEALPGVRPVAEFNQQYVFA